MEEVRLCVRISQLTFARSQRYFVTAQYNGGSQMRTEVSAASETPEFNTDTFMFTVPGGLAELPKSAQHTLTGGVVGRSSPTARMPFSPCQGDASAHPG